jgi:hypothetical protein
MSQLEVGKREECLVGWRGWTMYHPGFLASGNIVWLPGERNEAVCSAGGDHEAPQLGCSCGIYAFSQPYLVKEQGYYRQDLLGEVSLWGKVIEHERGYRAQYAYPKQLYITPHTDRGKLQLAYYIGFKYAVPVVEVGEDNEMLTESPAARAAKEKAVREEAERAAKMRALQAARTREGRRVLEKHAEKLPATRPGFKNMLEQINAEAAAEVAAQLAARAARKPRV